MEESSMKLKRALIFLTFFALFAGSAFADPSLKVGTLQMVVDGSGNPLGLLDLTNNPGLIQNTETGPSISGPWTPVANNNATIFQYLATGYNGGMWDGTTGIISSTAAADALVNFYTTLGNINGDDAINYLSLSDFYGAPITSTDALIKYTYYGDLDFNGIVDGTDYGFIDYAYGSGGFSGWNWGDFDYNGVIDGTDYGFIDYVYGSGGAPYGPLAGGSGPLAMIPIPEPSTVVLLLSSIVCALYVYLRKR
jgi:hypothetical protein